jgi:hypothetical protein
VSTKSDIKVQRGTKRTCQNPECGSRFYDLNRDPITCPGLQHHLRNPRAAGLGCTSATYATTSEEARAVRPR